MKSTFEFDGDVLRLYIKVEDRCEVALAKVLEKYNRATVSLTHPESSMYSYRDRDQDPTGVVVTLREAPKCNQTGTWCERGCERGYCELVPACEPKGNAFS